MAVAVSELRRLGRTGRRHWRKRSAARRAL